MARDRILILVELKGGNDGLNTLVPYADPLYRTLRPGIGLSREQVVPLDERLALHGKLEPLMASWQAKDLAIVQGLGYPYPNRSHFRSIEIWDTASASNQTLSEGWIAQAFKDVPRPAGPGVEGIVVDTNALPMVGPGLRTVVMQDAESFLRQASQLKPMERERAGANPALRHVLGIQAEVNQAAVGLRDRLSAGASPAESYAQKGTLGRQLDLATRLVLAQTPVRAIKVAIGSFDTHANQLQTHDRLLGQLGQGLATLRRNLIAAGRWNDVLVATYSEFGRRARQNASGGTDHGTAAPHFVMGGGVKGGLQGTTPSLADLQEGDLKHTLDFRAYFASLARAAWSLERDFGLRQPTRLDLIA
ncbi:MAG: DUF1501 domain-containing protein [Alphaproteobacteria bacterium]|nr:DUF1501 domain-containing protein [Alphaproteobacteria bacterium]